jgi:ferredoxin-type protein NapF
MNGDWDTWRSVMARQINPASLPRGRLKDRAPPLRPPWALGEAAFTAACECCGNCVEACPEKVLTVGTSGYPEMDFARGGCNFCAACVEACPGTALTKNGHGPWSILAHFAPSCLSLQGIICRLCEESCEARAIRFTPLYGGLALPQIDASACSGCGACVSACPAQAIALGR